MLAQWQPQCQCPRRAAFQCGLNESSNVDSFTNYLQAQLWRSQQQLLQHYSLPQLSYQPPLHASKQIMGHSMSPPEVSGINHHIWEFVPYSPSLAVEGHGHLPPMAYEDYPIYKPARYQQEIREGAIALNEAATISCESFASAVPAYSTTTQLSVSPEEQAGSDWLLTQPFQPRASIVMGANATSYGQASNLEQPQTIAPRQIFKFEQNVDASNWSTTSSYNELASSEDEYLSTAASDTIDDPLYDIDMGPNPATIHMNQHPMGGAIPQEWLSGRSHQALPHNSPLYDGQAPRQAQYKPKHRAASSLNKHPGFTKFKASGVRKTKDELLVELHDMGYTYRQIKTMCGFKEAESTLRGRCRTLRKPKDQRPRKPQWTENDETLLLLAVDGWQEKNGTANKISWKSISEWMDHAGSSQKFGFATCSKKYAALIAEGA